MDWNLKFQVDKTYNSKNTGKDWKEKKLIRDIKFKDKDIENKL